MHRSLAWMLLLALVVVSNASAEPGVAILLDSHRAGQSDLSARARRFCYVLIKQNQLADYQFSLKTIDIVSPEGRRFAREFALSDRDLPALGYYEREGNRIKLKNLVRRYQDPQKAAQDVFRCAQTEYPALVQSSEVITGTRVSTEPPGATVREGETELGVTPCQIALTPGRHELTIVEPDCAPERRTLNLKAGDNPELALQLARYPSTVTFESTGQPLEVFLDGQPVGTTPVTVNTSAGLHQLQAGAAGLFPIETDLRAEPNSRILARVQPAPVQVKVGWAGLEAEGFNYSYTSYTYDSGYSWGRRCRGNSYTVAIPYQVDVSVSLSAHDLTQRAQGLVLSRADLALLEVDRGWDCGLQIQVKADQSEVVGELTVLDPSGSRIQTFSAQRDMPWLSFDEEGAARKRADQIVKELVEQGLAWIHDNVPPGGLTPEEQKNAVTTTVEGPLVP